MDGDKEVCRLGVRNRRALFQGNEHIGTARERHTPLRFPLHEIPQASSDIQDDFLLHHACGANGSRILAAVPGVDDDMPAGVAGRGGAFRGRWGVAADAAALRIDGLWPRDRG
jgi:hypothetical protein